MCPFRDTNITCEECHKLSDKLDFVERESIVHSIKDDRQLETEVRKIINN